MAIGLSIALAVCCTPSSYRESIAIPGTALSIELAGIPASHDASAPPLLVGMTEIPWEVYDCFVYGFDQAAGSAGGGERARDASRGESSREPSQGEAADAVTRPTKPYISVDRGFGHAGWPAISMSFKGATDFCAWLSAKTGRPFRLPTAAEWTRLCTAAERGAAPLEERAWTAINSGGTTRKVGTAKADALGLHDLCGNVAEWCVADDGKGVVMGGSFRDAPEAVGCAALQQDTPNWNRSDPQFPKSVWWLADAPHVGMRVVCEVPATPAAGDAAAGARVEPKEIKTP